MYLFGHDDLGICCCCTTRIEALVLVSEEASKSPITPNSENSVQLSSAAVCGDLIPLRLPTMKKSCRFAISDTKAVVSEGCSIETFSYDTFSMVP